MTTIDEMDEFFNFEDAADQLGQNDLDFSHLQSGDYDIDLAFAEPELDESSFTCLQHFSTSEEQLSQNAFANSTMMGADDFTDFPRWIEGMDVPTKPCAYCRRMRIHCKILKEGLRKGSCTSCVALARSCSLTHPDPHSRDQTHDINMSSQSFGFTSDVVDDSGELNFSDWPADPCHNCRAQGLDCKISQNDANGSCLNCVSFVMPCSLAVQWLSLNPEGNLNGSNSNLASPLEGSFSQNNSATDLLALKNSDENINAVDPGDRGPKVGARFSRESIRILRGWLSTHQTHPYPTDEEKEVLQRQTGLNKTQITNWLANARRRGKVRAPRSTSPSVRGFSDAMDIPRRATPAPENMTPLERWKHSPPEHEAASVTAIAKAVTTSTFSSGRDSPYTNYGHTDDGSARSVSKFSSASSLGTSHGTSHSRGSSGNSFASAFSHKSKGSFGSFGSFGNRGRRRRRRQAPKAAKISPSTTPARTFQCTFCTETFKTKHDWQRHEKSLHLSLERWVCCPNGPTQFCAEYDHNRCVFCGLPNPPADHAEIHNYSSCVERSLEERTFYRKDHLRQHLNLVHDVKFQTFSMESWKVVTPEIRSRCGFCGIIMDSWSIRVDHLAEHFKGGKSMADWKGDWGFEPQVLDIVENGMPPYLIHDERNSMNPFVPSQEPPQKDRTVEDLVKIGLVEYVHEQILNGETPTDASLLIEARKIVTNADQYLTTSGDPEISWFRDLIMLSGTAEDEVSGKTAGLPWAQKLERIAAQAPHKAGLESIPCSKQRSLMAFVKRQQSLGLTPSDTGLQAECCRILDEVESSSNYKCRAAVAWFKYLINADTCWLREFRRWASLPRSSEMKSEAIRSTDDKSIDYAIHNHARLVRELIEWTKFQLSLGIHPSDAELQQQARLIVYKNDDPWNQTAIDDPSILLLFKRQSGLAPTDDMGARNLEMPLLAEACHEGRCEDEMNPPQHPSPSPRTLHWDVENNWIGIGNTGYNWSSQATGPSMKVSRQPPVLSPSKTSPNSEQNSRAGPSTPAICPPLHTTIQNQPSANSNPVQPLKYFLNDANCYGRLVRELSRFVTTCTSPNNPNQHIPTDAEIQNQARWIIYDDDDPWNQTAADNAEWLVRFKRDVGLAPQESGPGLPFSGVLSPTNSLSSSWQVENGGSGFAPPYLCPKAPLPEFFEDVPVTINHKTYNVKAATAAKFVEGISQQWQKPATVFCSRELENGLNEFVTKEMSNGVVPSDDVLRSKAREILGVEQTAADDILLLTKFKAMHGITQAPESTPAYDEDMLAEFDQELGSMDLSGVEMPASSKALLDASIPALMAEGMQKKFPLLEEGALRDYAEFYKVNAATASPLRRRVSEKMAERKGFALGRHEASDGFLLEVDEGVRGGGLGR